MPAAGSLTYRESVMPVRSSSRKTSASPSRRSEAVRALNPRRFAARSPAVHGDPLPEAPPYRAVCQEPAALPQFPPAHRRCRPWPSHCFPGIQIKSPVLCSCYRSGVFQNTLQRVSGSKSFQTFHRICFQFFHGTTGKTAHLPHMGSKDQRSFQIFQKLRMSCQRIQPVRIQYKGLLSAFQKPPDNGPGPLPQAPVPDRPLSHPPIPLPVPAAG